MNKAIERASPDPGGDLASGPAGLSALRPSEREAMEDLLRALLECTQQGAAASDERLATLAGMPRETVVTVLARGAALGLVAREDNDGWRLTRSGREVAVRVMRAHRLIETRLARESSVPAHQWHEVAHATEHALSREEVDRLADRLENPRFDPHGDPIPTREGHWPGLEGEPLLTWSPGEEGVIAHIEDEPKHLFKRLARAGVFAGMRLILRERTPAACRIGLEGRELVIVAELAALIQVRARLDSERPLPAGARRLSDLARGECAEVLMLLPGCIGAERSRLLDLGLVPGSRIEHALQSPFHGPAAYRVRGTLVALRREQAEQVLIGPCACAG